MRMKIPITGTVKKIHPYISGDNNDPIRPINLNLENVSWKLITLDIENEYMEIEVTPSPEIRYDTGEVDNEKEPIFITRPTTVEEKAHLIEGARNLSLERMPKDDLYALSGSPRLKNPFKVASVE